MTRMALAVIVASAGWLTGAQVPRESPLPAQETEVSGRVLADETGDPVANTRVTLTSAARGAPVVLTDGDGRFTIGASPGRHSVVAN